MSEVEKSSMRDIPEPRPARSDLWKPGHRIELLENGEEFFPRVFQAVAAAQLSILIETFILFQDEVGNELQRLLIEAAQRGVRVDLTVDGYGSPLTADFIDTLTRAGVTLHIYDPRPTLMGLRTNWFRRLHRKIVVVDQKLAFIGGINYSIDHLRKSGPESKQDWSISIEGPVVDDIQALAESFIRPQKPVRRLRFWRRARLPVPSKPSACVGNAAAALIARDNRGHRDDIERHYRTVLRGARQRVIIANAYFVPGYRLLRAIRDAARRGVAVNLILQGHSDKWITQWAGGILYGWLLAGGVRVHEYRERPLHGKVAVVDEEWATVGSSNLDPLSLSLNLEANVMILDRSFNALLAQRLESLMQQSCREVKPKSIPVRTYGQQALSFLLFHLLRWYPAVGGWLPAHNNLRIKRATADATPELASPPSAAESAAPAEGNLDATRDG